MSFSEALHERELDRMREMVVQPDWYMELGATHRVRSLGLGAVQAAMNGSIIEAGKKAKERTLEIFEQLLAEEVVTLGSATDPNLEDWDEERQPIDRVVIHHTSREPGLTNERLNAMHLLRLYVPRYQSKSTPVMYPDGTRQPIYSGHFDGKGRQIFYAYHWLIKNNGEAERLLEDSAIGWQAGDWATNCRSIAICIDDDLTLKRPSSDALASIADVITREYPDITLSPETIVGHREVSKISTECPGSEFLGGWKLELLDKLSS